MIIRLRAPNNQSAGNVYGICWDIQFNHFLHSVLLLSMASSSLETEFKRVSGVSPGMA
jgi:hypothetical protein